MEIAAKYFQSAETTEACTSWRFLTVMPKRYGRAARKISCDLQSKKSALGGQQTANPPTQKSER
jgi:hypothetical protein